jgi:hypothetical protein
MKEELIMTGVSPQEIDRILEMRSLDIDEDNEDLWAPIHLKEARCSGAGRNGDVWRDLYANDEYCEKIMKKDIDMKRKGRESDIRHQNRMIQPVIPQSYEERKARLIRKLNLNPREPGDVTGILIRDPDGNVRANMSDL